MSVKRVVRNVIMSAISLFLLTGSVVMLTVDFQLQAAVLFFVTGIMLFPFRKRKRKTEREKQQYYKSFTETRRPAVLVHADPSAAHAQPVASVPEQMTA